MFRGFRLLTRRLAAFVVSAVLAFALIAEPAFAQEATTGPTATTTTLPPSAEEPLISGDTLFILLVVVVVFGISLLAFIVWRISRGSQTIAETEKRAFAFRPLIEGMVLVMVIVAVIILGITGKVTAEGLATILAAIVGYAVGRNVSELQSNHTRPTQSGGGTPATGDGTPATGDGTPATGGGTPAMGGGTPATGGGTPATGGGGDAPLIQPIDTQSPEFIEFTQQQLERTADPTALFNAVKEEGEIEQRDPFPPPEKNP